MPNIHLRPRRVACALAATAIFSVAGATAASAATGPDLPLVGGLTGGLTDGLLGGNLPVVGGLLDGSGGVPVVGDLLGGGVPVVGDLEGLPVIGGGALPIAPGTLPVGTVLNSVPVVGPLVGGILGGVLDGVTGGGATGGANTGGGHTGGGNTHHGGGTSTHHHQGTSSVRMDDRSDAGARDHADVSEDTDNGDVPSGGVRAGFGGPVSEGAGGASALPLALLGAAAIGSVGVGVRRLISSRGAE
jgi:hypothetical protein